MSKLISYAQWCEVFNKIENWEIGHTDSEIINAIDNGTIDWVSGVAERFTNQILTLIKDLPNWKLFIMLGLKAIMTNSTCQICLFYFEKN